jgi:hypothetical protein
MCFPWLIVARTAPLLLFSDSSVGEQRFQKYRVGRRFDPFSENLFNEEIKCLYLLEIEISICLMLVLLL